MLDGSLAPLLGGAPPPEPAELGAAFRRFGVLLQEARGSARRGPSGLAPGTRLLNSIAAESAVMVASHKLITEVRCAALCWARWPLAAGCWPLAAG